MPGSLGYPDPDYMPGWSGRALVFSLVGLVAMSWTVQCSCVYMYVNGSLVYSRAIARRETTWGLRALESQWLLWSAD